MEDLTSIVPGKLSVPLRIWLGFAGIDHDALGGMGWRGLVGFPWGLWTR
jgi:hypothetical protein